MKIKFKCDFCEALFDSAAECNEHEIEDCDDNPALKACTTCEHETDEVGDTGKIYYGCDKGLVETSPNAFRKNCEGWEKR